MAFTTNLRNTLWALFTALCLFIAASAVLNLRNLHRDEEMIEAYLAPTLLHSSRRNACARRSST